LVFAHRVLKVVVAEKVQRAARSAPRTLSRSPLPQRRPNLNMFDFCQSLPTNDCQLCKFVCSSEETESDTSSHSPVPENIFRESGFEGLCGPNGLRSLSLSISHSYSLHQFFVPPNWRKKIDLDKAGPQALAAEQRLFSNLHPAFALKNRQHWS